ncbi:major facilitator superfamily transporter [Niveomyces insectorum RCEF 264]|uniref:Major facilitator superfamily transporter n=1 Tax=Niveomyces insectorum RCEF 264 TaxID=1081102 RepID=A0A167VCY6_9HYPO|nr:major facilitator superfamily transporter [Niveomyces insectorum RCEF 264]
MTNDDKEKQYSSRIQVDLFPASSDSGDASIVYEKATGDSSGDGLGNNDHGDSASAGDGGYGSTITAGPANSARHGDDMPPANGRRATGTTAAEPIGGREPPPNAEPDRTGGGGIDPDAGNVNGNGNGNDNDGDGLATEQDTEQETYPEGGLEAWLVVLGAWLALFSSLGIMNSLATFQSYVSTHQLAGQSQGTIGWIFSLYAFICFFAGVYIGPMFDKYGPRWLVLTGTVCLVVGLVLLSLCKLFWHFILAFGVLGGLSSALLFTPSIAAVGHFFSERRGFATGIASTGGGIGGVCIPLMMQRLFDRVGWGWAVRILALLALVLAGVSNLLLRSRLKPARDASAHPDIHIFRSVPFALTTLGIFLLEFALFIPLTYISNYALSRGLSASFASQAVTVLNAGSVVGRVLPGWYADKIGPFNANMSAVIVAIVSCLGVWLPTSMLDTTRTSADNGGDRRSAAVAPVVLFALLFGFTSGSNISLAPVSIGRLCATANYGRYYATCYTIVSVATLIGIPIAGNILAANNGNYWGLIVFTSALYVGSLVALYAAKVSVVGWSWKNTF